MFVEGENLEVTFNDDKKEVYQNLKNQMPVAPQKTIEQIQGEELLNAIKKVKSQSPVKGEFVSETFANLMKETSQPNTIPASENIARKMVEVESYDTNEVNKNLDILHNISIDVNEIDVIDDISPEELKMSIEKNLGILADTKRLYSIICFQSGYKADISGLKNSDIQNLFSQDVNNPYVYQKKYYQILFKHIENTSFGRIKDFDTWMKVTSLFDLETVLFGVYNATFPYENTFKIPCTECNKTFEFLIKNNSLITVKNEELEDLFIKSDTINRERLNPEELRRQSHMNMRKKIVLEDSKLVFELKIPSLYIQLEELMKNSGDMKESNESLYALIFIDNVKIPDLIYLKNNNKLRYLTVKDFPNKLRILNNLEYHDALELSEKIEELMNKYRVSYSIKSPTCKYCHKDLSDYPVRLEDLLFTVISQGRRGKKEMMDSTTM